MNEQIVNIAARLYECRKACRTLFGARYAEIMGPYERTIRAVAAARKIEIIPAALAMADEMRAEVNNDPVITMCLMAAAVDIVEPIH